jgi:hypothetical protein
MFVDHPRVRVMSTDFVGDGFLIEREARTTRASQLRLQLKFSRSHTFPQPDSGNVLCFLERLAEVEDLFDGLLEAALGLADVEGSNAGAAMCCEAIQPAGAQRIMQLGVDQRFNRSTKRFGLTLYHGCSPCARCGAVRMLRDGRSADKTTGKRL